MSDHDQPDDLDSVAAEIAAVTGELALAAGFTRGDDQQAAADALAKAAAEAGAAHHVSTAPPDPDASWRRDRVAQLSTQGPQRTAVGHIAVTIWVDYDTAAAVLDQRLDVAIASEVGYADVLTALGDHIHEWLPNTVPPPSIDQWRHRLTEIEADGQGPHADAGQGEHSMATQR